MKRSKSVTAMALLGTFAAGVFSPLALAQSSDAGRQKHKNDWRNLGGAAAAVAGYGLLKGDTTATVLGAAGAAYSAKRYEEERRSQDAMKRARQRAQYHRASPENGRKYYRYQGRLYYMDLATGARVLVD